MKMIPPVVAETTDSPAERKIFTLLERTALDRNAVALHSIDLPSHIYKRMGEIDFIVLSRAGLLVCEVKGGGVHRSDDGYWHFTNRYGETNRKAEGPFKQASSAMWSLHADLRQRMERELFEQVSFGFCVMLLDSELRDDSVDSPRELTIDASEFAGARELGSPLQRLFARWQVRNGIGDMTPEALDQARNSIRTSFDLVPSLGTRARGISAQLEALTEEQYAGLDWVESSPRLLIAGGAGTGKTLLAVEVARREALRGSRVLLTCQSPVLAKYLRTRAPANVEVAPVARVEELVASNGDRFDVVVIDEAQDVFSIEGVTILDQVVKGGIDEGRWRCFYDLNNQAGLFGSIEIEAFELLRATGAHQVPLQRNCRNTKPIVLQTQTVTAADLGIPMAGEGPAVDFAKPRDAAEEALLLAEELQRLAEADVSPAAITILTGDAEPSPLQIFERDTKVRLARLDETTAGSWPFDRMSVAPITDFKGFENDFILVTGLTDLDATRRARALVYVAMSRARVGLWVAIPAELGERFEAVRQRNVERVIQIQRGRQ